MDASYIVYCVIGHFNFVALTVKSMKIMVFCDVAVLLDHPSSISEKLVPIYKASHPRKLATK
jgi:hypothetical protein